jgi:DUF971 family protein
MERTQATAVTLDVRENLLTIAWADGTKCLYDGGYLRYLCPCAGCRGHAPGDVEPPPWEACRDVRVTNAEAVGGYAVRFTFSDRHETGIYTWEWLREICPAEREGVDERGRPRP